MFEAVKYIIRKRLGACVTNLIDRVKYEVYLKISLKTYDNRSKAVIGGIYLVTIQDTELREGILTAIDRAKAISRSVLVSEIQKIDRIDPFFFFTAGRDAFLGERFFWKDPAGDHVLAGLGICKQIQSDQASDRFFVVEKNWNEFLENAIIHNPYKVNGTGPAMFGGFSFDPLKEKTSLWSKFADSLFHIPKYMLSVIDGEAYFTTNVVCTPHDDKTLYEKIITERQAIVSRSDNYTPFSQPELGNKEEIAPESWKKAVEEVVATLGSGELKKVVLARELKLYFRDEIYIEAVLERLIQEQQESFIFAFESNGDCFIGATPERLLKKNESGVFSACLAGSTARGKTPEEDRFLGDSLLNDEKNLIEHQYVVEMISEAMRQTCDEVVLPNKPQLMKMKYIQHLYTPVLGKNRDGTSLLQIAGRLHPTPALGGLPQQLAVEKIRDVEKLDRGMYAAPIGWMDYEGNGEFAVAIRSGLLKGREASLFAGCGIVADSDPDNEYTETNIKFRPMLSALGGKSR
ncbi:isochorismate synthase [Bacillus sp. T33-2]|uniref:isochorismate synthase n=1 Tax=Bacillus sp. T33-2 TaxID=2054168 RepID=UPI000C78F423|nr:isochorismate synthase [Bacillus sp. T33-2]PLR98257.1 isochorismate synthase [Bacillus sp. T33-2]